MFIGKPFADTVGEVEITKLQEDAHHNAKNKMIEETKEEVEEEEKEEEDEEEEEEDEKEDGMRNHALYFSYNQIGPQDRVPNTSWRL